MPEASNDRKQRDVAAKSAIPLTDDKGSGIAGNLLDGTAVEILSWVPGGAKTLYHVRSKDGALAWVGAKDLRAGMSAATRPGSRKRAAARKAVRARAKRPKTAADKS